MTEYLESFILDFVLKKEYFVMLLNLLMVVEMFSANPNFAQLPLAQQSLVVQEAIASCEAEVIALQPPSSAPATAQLYSCLDIVAKSQEVI